MSRCDIQISFDHPERTYRGGQVVSGVVTIDVNKDTSCKEVLLTYYWRTHGRGNRSQGQQHRIALQGACQLTVGQRLELPFEFEAERWPVTYRGHYINVDHYVKVAVDVPWAIDPKQEEDYILVGGMAPEEFRGDLSQVLSLNAQSKAQLPFALKVFLFIVFGLVAIVFSFLLVFLVPVFLVGFGCWWVWKKAIQSRVGNVEYSIPEVVTAPGRKWRARLKFTPQKSFAINGITLKLKAIESATSGSGTNATTYRHTIFEQEFQWMPAATLQAQQLFEETLEIDFPDTQAWSLKRSDNRVEWTAEARIDIPRFPDWSQRTELQLVPACFLEDDVSTELLSESQMLNASESPEHSALRDQMSLPNESNDVAGDDPTSVQMEPILKLLDEILAISRFGNDREHLVEKVVGQQFDVAVYVDRNSSTFGLRDAPEEYSNGRTIVGKLHGTDTEMQIFSLADHNDWVSDLGREQCWTVTVTIREWDSLYDRFVALQVH